MTDTSFSKKTSVIDGYISNLFFNNLAQKFFPHASTFKPRNTRLAIKLNKVAQTEQMKQILTKPPSIIQRSIDSSRHEMNRKNALAITSAGVV